MNNIVLIVVDCGRFDKFQNKVAATFINQLADKGWNFTNAISPYNQTQSAMASMFTGKLPSEHLVQSHRDDRFVTEYPVLSEILKSKGYTTIGASAVFWLHDMFGWGRGFDFYNCPADLSEDASTSAYDLFKSVQKHIKLPFFLYMQVGDVHVPYKYPVALKGEFDDYDASLKFLDLQLRSIISALPPNTTYIITADHGVGLGEYNSLAWGQGPNSWLYDVVIHVPLIVYGPSVPPKVISDLVSTKDIFALITQEKIAYDTYAISESYAYHNINCIHKDLNYIGRERCMKGYRCIVDSKYKLIESEDNELFFFDRSDESTQLGNFNKEYQEVMLKELHSRSKMNLKDKRIDIVLKRMNKFSVV